MWLRDSVRRPRRRAGGVPTAGQTVLVEQITAFFVRDYSPRGASAIPLGRHAGLPSAELHHTQRMLSCIRSAALLGIDAYPVDVEIDISSGLPTFSTVGLGHGAVKEGRERVSAALANAGFEFPLKRITVNLAPADIRKDGSSFDLPIALGILTASGQLPEERLADTLVVGEVGLEGDLRPVRGALSMALAARAAGCTGLLLPHANLPEA